jgi:hypothetical protein
MKAVTGVFRSRSDAERAMAQIGVLGVSERRYTFLTPDANPGAAGSKTFGDHPVVTAKIPGVGFVNAVGILGTAVLEGAGARLDSGADRKLGQAASEAWPEGELFVYEEVLRKGGTVLIALSDDEAQSLQLRGLLNDKGAEATDAAREQWWTDLRGTEREHYSALDGNFEQDEKFYRLGFEAALHARMRCKEYDQVLSEMAVQIEEVQRQYPGSNVEEPFTKGYERGRDHYEQLCGEDRVA